MQHDLTYADRYVDNQIAEPWLMDPLANMLCIQATTFVNLIKVHIISKIESLGYVLQALLQVSGGRNLGSGHEPS